jgi:hypothetical protein
MRNCTGQKQEKEEKSICRKQAGFYPKLKNFLVHKPYSIAWKNEYRPITKQVTVSSGR